MKYEILKDEIFNKWLVFERHGNLLIEVSKKLRSTRKKDCETWVKKHTRIRPKKSY